MQRKYGRLRLFAKKELRFFFDEKKLSLARSIESEDENYLLNVNENDYIEHKKSMYSIEPLDINITEIYASSSEQMIPAELFPQGFTVFSGKSYKKVVIKFHIPYSGDSELLKYTPSTRIIWSIDIQILNNEICFEIINFNDDTELITREKDSSIVNIIKQNDNIKADIISYNNNLTNIVTTLFNKRKQQILKNNSIMASLGVPIMNSDSVSSTFSIPTPETRKKIIIKRPKVVDTGYKPEPSLDDIVYNQILKLIHDVGKEFERLPSLYSDKEEEHLRDHFLMMLEPNFHGSATGETFNKKGKTDILLRYDGSNVFIAECKFWNGQKKFLDTITQLLSYLTWRDSKAAIIIFVTNKEFTSVIETMKLNIIDHNNYLDFNNCQDETWFNYNFHIQGDRNRIVKIAVMLYHLP